MLDKPHLFSLQGNEYRGKHTRSESSKQNQARLESSQESDERDPETAHLLRAQGNAALKAGNIDKAVEFYSQGLKRNPDDHVLYSNRSAAYLRLHNFQAALADAEKCTELEPNWCKVLTAALNEIMHLLPPTICL